MKLRHITAGMLAASSLALGGAGMAQPQPASPAAPASPGSPQTAPTPAAPGAAGQPPANQAAGNSQLEGDDKDFLEKAAHAGFTEVEGSKLAQEKASDPEVKAFAEQMIQEHTKANEELAALAKQKGYTPPTDPSLVQSAKLKVLGMTDDSFDRNYMGQIGVSAHEDAIELFRDAAEKAKDPDIKAFAQKMLPSLEKHLEMARALHQKVGGDGGDADKQGAAGTAQPGAAK